MSASIYDQHDKAFSKVQAFVILKDGERVATVAIKFPADGAGRLWAYAHVTGLQMQRASADGYGYDKRSPAVRSAFGLAKSSKVDADIRKAFPDGTRAAELQATRNAIVAAVNVSDGEYWDRLLEKAGFTVFQAV